MSRIPAVGDFVLSVIPADPRWQPSREAGERMAVAHPVRQVLAHI